MLISTHAQVDRLRRVQVVLAFPMSGQGRHTKARISELNSWPSFPPIRTLGTTFFTGLALSPEVEVDGYSFFVREVCSLSKTGFISAPPDPFGFSQNIRNLSSKAEHCNLVPQPSVRKFFSQTLFFDANDSVSKDELLRVAAFWIDVISPRIHSSDAIVVRRPISILSIHEGPVSVCELDHRVGRNTSRRCPE
ncbi:hypothetical protein CA13_55110 [Planctomycetes bacterium CA13]|uniref:Uncharacterized protein n=1 Tax=Novipirellula herctigrandis TaxID=2527986 RepID=A0A5C5ZA98_9BACT|nr:hypothetical protein CA13_55110 [Planctomycetes bacterium CA13]